MEAKGDGRPPMSLMDAKSASYDADSKMSHGFSSKPAKNVAAKDYPLSPTDNLLSPCSQKLRRKRSKKLSEDSVEYWRLPDGIDIILGSTSIARANILREVGWEFRCVNPRINKKSVTSNDPFRLPVLLAKAEATAVLEEIQGTTVPTVIITADQIVLFENEVRGVPVNEDEAREFLLSYHEGKIVQIVSGVVATHIPSGRQSAELDICTIHWNGIPENVVERFLATKDMIYESAGAILIEDPDFLQYVDHIEGQLDSIRGLPVAAMKRTIRSVVSSDI
mmetsp:Transcript_22299/g.32459  ORF Transcript_22299/g.32459 Transcript_22299/m.32459 type:complete len:279 (+) Transcript_22299:118-954(+)